MTFHTSIPKTTMVEYDGNDECGSPHIQFFIIYTSYIMALKLNKNTSLIG